MDAVSLSKIIIKKCNDKNIPISITKLHKLLYIVYGTYLIIENKSLFDNDEDNCPSCFEYGPLFKSVQREYKNGNINFEDKNFEDKNLEDKNLEDKVLPIVDVVISKFGAYSARALSDWSHRKGSAWDKAEKEDKYRWGNIIKDEYIKDEFKNIVKLDKNG